MLRFLWRIQIRMKNMEKQFHPPSLPSQPGFITQRGGEGVIPCIGLVAMNPDVQPL